MDNRSLASSNLSDYFHDSMPPATLKSTQKEADDNFTNNSPVTTKRWPWRGDGTSPIGRSKYSFRH